MQPELIAAAAALAVLLAVASALLSAVETALFSLGPHQVKKIAENKPLLGNYLDAILENPRRLLTAILLADVMVNIPLIVIGLLLMKELGDGLFPYWLKAALLFGLIVLLCDLAPKLIALRAPNRIAELGAPLMHLLLPLIDPVARRLQDGCEAIAERLTPARWKPHRYLTEDEIETLVQISAEEGALGFAESEIIQEIIKLGDKTAKDVMTPRTEMFAVPDDLDNAELIGRLRRRRCRRVPVYGESPDDILGVVDVRSFLLDPAAHYTESMMPPSFVPETMKALDLLKSFLTHPQRLAIVLDEFGGTEGLVTLSDIVEEIIGDAVPAADQGLTIENLGRGRLLVAGATRLDDLAETGVALEAPEGVDTIGGLVFNTLGTLPKPGEELALGGYRITVRRVSRKRIAELLIEDPRCVLPAEAAAP